MEQKQRKIYTFVSFDGFQAPTPEELSTEKFTKTKSTFGAHHWNFKEGAENVKVVLGKRGGEGLISYIKHTRISIMFIICMGALYNNNNTKIILEYKSLEPHSRNLPITHTHISSGNTVIEIWTMLYIQYSLDRCNDSIYAMLCQRVLSYMYYSHSE